RLGEAEQRLLGDIGGLQRYAQILPASEPVGVGVAYFAQQRSGRGITQAHLQRGGGLFGDIDSQVGAVRLAARHILDLHILEEAQAANAGTRTVDQHAVEGIALLQPELAADDAVQGARIAGNVDLFDIDARPLRDLEAEIDGTGLWVAPQPRMNL